MRRFRFTIAQFLLAAGVLALVLAALRPERGPVPVFAAKVLFGVVFALMGLLFLPLFIKHPLRKALEDPPADQDRLIETLEMGLALPYLGNREVLAKARYRLLGLYKTRKRYEEAVAQGRAILHESGLKSAFKSEVHLEVAVCLDFLGRDQEAAEERRMAEACLDGEAEGQLGWLAQGKLFDKDGRYPDAVEAYQRSLAMTPADHSAMRIDLLIRLTLATFNAGRPEETVRWAERAIAEGAVGERLLSATRMAGVASSNLGRLDQAERYRRRAYTLAKATGDPKKIAENLAALAEVFRSRGRLDKAERLALQAEALCPESPRMALVVQAVTLYSLGRLDEALERVERASQSGAMQSAFFERRIQAVYRRSMALYKAGLGRPGDAWSDLLAAVVELRDDPKLGPICEATAIWLLALEGHRDEALRRLEALEPRLAAVAEDRTTQLDSLEPMGRALVALQEFGRARSCWERFLECNGHPVAEPLGWYFLGECRRHLGDPSGARDAYRRATAPGIPTEPARLASDRLRELTDEPPVPSTVF